MTDVDRDAAERAEVLGRLARTVTLAPATCVELGLPVVAQARAAEDERTEMAALYHVGFAHHLLSQDHEALQALERAQRLAEHQGDLAWQARIVGGLGVAHSGFGDNASAIELLEQSLDIRRELGDTAGIATALNDLGMTFEQMGLFPERAQQLLVEAHGHFSALADDEGCCRSLGHLAALDTRQAERAAAEDPELARLQATEGLRNARLAVGHARRTDNPLLLGETLLQEARALIACGLDDEAVAVLDEASDLAGRIETSHFRLGLATLRGRLHRVRGEHDAAVAELERGLALCDGLLRTFERVDLLDELVTTHEDRGAYAEALAAHRRLLAATLEQRDEAAERRARTVNARLDVERAKVAAEVERLRSEQLERVNRELEHKASHDALTGLANRRAFDTALEARTSGAGSVTCLLGDLDHFKQVNDRFSHPVGDEVLRRVARLVTAAVRGTDLVARIGGEELAVLLDAPSTAEVAAVSERIRAAVASHPWHEIVPELAVTISIGAATRRSDEPADALVARADALLYEAKCTGRDRVVTDATSDVPAADIAAPDVPAAVVPSPSTPGDDRSPAVGLTDVAAPA